MDSWTLYWITRLDGVVGAIETLLILSIVFMVILSFVLGIAIMIKFNEGGEEFTNVIKAGTGYMRFWIVAGSLLVLHVLIPTTKDMIMIKVIPQIVNSE